MLNLEYELWTALVSGPREYGRLLINQRTHSAQLRNLSQAAGGWIIFDDE